MIGKLAIGLLLVGAFYVVGTHPDTHALVNSDKPAVQMPIEMDTQSSQQIETRTEPLTRSNISVTEVVTAKDTNVTTKTNDVLIWERLIAEGFTREQAAGIMGNLQQEHNFQTSDTSGGLGIVQWIGNRRANLMARENYIDIHVQLNFMLDELRGVESYALRKVQAATTVEEATIAFQNAYERCGNCKQSQRIMYAQQILLRF